MADLKKKSIAELAKERAQKEKALREFRFGIAGSKTRNTKEGKNLRKGIARILTEERARKDI